VIDGRNNPTAWLLPVSVVVVEAIAVGSPLSWQQYPILQAKLQERSSQTSEA
jgi:hypothetical protein